MPSTFTRSARRVVPIKSAILAGAAPARRRMVHPAAASELRRRADDVEHGTTSMPSPQNAGPVITKNDGRLMNDWPEDNKPASRATAASMWDSRPCLLAAFWGWLPNGPRK